MLCYPYSVRESSGIARWLQAVSGMAVQLAGEDANAPDDTTSDTAARSPYWGLVVGQQLESQRWPDRVAPLVLTRNFTLDIQAGVSHDYVLVVGTTRVVVEVLDSHVQADVPGLVVEAWTRSGLALGHAGQADGPEGLLLSALGDNLFQVTGNPAFGGVPWMDYGWGLAFVSETVTPEPWTTSLEIITHSYIATFWAWVRGRGEAKRACLALEQAASKDDSADLLMRFTGQVAIVTTSVLDALALGTGDASGNMDVAQVEIVVDAMLVSAVPGAALAGLAITVQTGTGVPGDNYVVGPLAIETQEP